MFDLNGYIDVLNLKIVVVVIYLEMIVLLCQLLVLDWDDVVFECWKFLELLVYKKLFWEVGEGWIWFGCLMKLDVEFVVMLVELVWENYLFIMDGKLVGILEFNYVDLENVEFVYFGFVFGVIGGGLGKWFMLQVV